MFMLMIDVTKLYIKQGSLQYIIN